jgi:hypothetical protein
VTVTNGEVRAALDHISATLATKFEMTAHLALTIVPRLDDLGTDFRAQFASEVSGSFERWSASDAAEVYEALREFIARHLEHADAAWSLNAEQLAPLIALRDLVEPGDPLLRYRWLFKKDWVTLSDTKRRDDFAALEREIAERRLAAVASIFGATGLDGVIALAAQADPWVVGLSLGNTSEPVERDLLQMFPTEDTIISSLVAGFFASRLRSADSPIEALLDEFDDAKRQAFLLRYSPDQQAAQDRLHELGGEVGEIYWRNFNHYSLGADFSKAVEVGWSLLDADRPVAALTLNLLYLRNTPADEETADLFAAALEALLVKSEPDPEISNLHQYELEQIFDVLAAHREHLGSARIVTLEWQLLPLSSFDGRAPALHAEIKSNPEFFIELIVACFREAAETKVEDGADVAEDGTESRSPETLTEHQRSTAIRAWEVLRSCEQVPGVRDDNTLDVAELESWIRTVRAGLAAVDRAAIGDLHIGELVSHAPQNEDGSPLTPELRDLLERLGSDEILRGIATGIFNSRGIVSRSLTDGGAQEWQLAKKYRAYASASGSWPTIRRMLEGIAEGYEADARREDLSAEKRRLGLR